MGDVSQIAPEKGTTVAVDRCARCGFTVEWRVTGGKKTVWYNCLRVHEETLDRCGHYVRESFKRAEDFFRAYDENGRNPVDRRMAANKQKGGGDEFYI